MATPLLASGAAAMAETSSEAEHAVSYLLAEEEGVDFLRESLTWVMQQLVPGCLLGAPRACARARERRTKAWT